MGEAHYPEALDRAHERLRRLLKEYQRIGGKERGGARALELIVRIRETGAYIADLQRRRLSP
jgi:hypothetical protein